MREPKKSNKLKISVSLDAEEQEKFEIVKASIPLKRNPDVVRVAIAKAFNGIKANKREELKAELAQKGILPIREVSNG